MESTENNTTNTPLKRGARDFTSVLRPQANLPQHNVSSPTNTNTNTNTTTSSTAPPNRFYSSLTTPAFHAYFAASTPNVQKEISSPSLSQSKTDATSKPVHQTNDDQHSKDPHTIQHSTDNHVHGDPHAQIQLNAQTTTATSSSSTSSSTLPPSSSSSASNPSLSTPAKSALTSTLTSAPVSAVSDSSFLPASIPSSIPSSSSSSSLLSSSSFSSTLPPNTFESTPHTPISKPSSAATTKQSFRPPTHLAIPHSQSTVPSPYADSQSHNKPSIRAFISLSTAQQPSWGQAPSAASSVGLSSEAPPPPPRMQFNSTAMSPTITVSSQSAASNADYGAGYMASSGLLNPSSALGSVSVSVAASELHPHMHRVSQYRDIELTLPRDDSKERSDTVVDDSSPNPFSKRVAAHFPVPIHEAQVDEDDADSSRGSFHSGQDEAQVFSGLHLYGGEAPVASFTCELLNDRKGHVVAGAMYVTLYRLGFVPSSGASMTDSDRDYSTIPLCLIHNIEKLPGRKIGQKTIYALEVTCKDFRVLRFLFTSDSQTRRDAFQTLQKFAFPTSRNRDLFAFMYTPTMVFSLDGWKLFDPVIEFKRMGVPCNQWRISYANVGYKFSETYPELIAVPTSVTDEDLMSVATFRSRGRIPALSWKHLINQAAIVRCSQPLVGVSGKRNREDEKLLDAIAQNCSKTKVLHIMDSRPRANAIANQVKGAGFENTSHYKKMPISFMNIENIHVVRDAHNKLRQVCLGYGSTTLDYNLRIGTAVDHTQTSPYEHWFSLVNATQWLTHIKTILFATAKLVRLIAKGESVLIHCSDGWDRTAQQSSLAMLCLDPYYRTLEGFMVLIEKEWCNFGHKFDHRTGHGDKRHDDEDRSPIFPQFIDCVWQMMRQFPRAFQFNELFLTHILDHLYSCRFGTFLVNNERDSKIFKLHTTTTSLWSYLNENKHNYESKRYSGPDVARAVASVSPPLIPNPHSILVTLWSNYYLRWTVHSIELDIRLPSEFFEQDGREGLHSQMIPSTPLGATGNLFSQMLDLKITEAPSQSDQDHSEEEEDRVNKESENILLKEKIQQIEELQQQVRELQQEIETLNALNHQGSLRREFLSKQEEVVRVDCERASVGSLGSVFANQLDSDD